MTEQKKLWIDIEEPKTAIMFKSLIEKFQNINANILITARDYDSTYNILDDLDIKYHKIGKHGGEKLEDKLEAYIFRLNELFPLVSKFEPDYFVTFSSVEGTRISYGLNIPSIGYNDEPRNVHVCKLIFPYLDHIITPDCIPREQYLKLGATPDKILRYDGIDEIAWLSEYIPNQDVLKKFDLEKGKYIIMRSEPSFASYFVEKLQAEETLISQFFSKIYQIFPDFKYLILIRTQKQEIFLKNKLKNFENNKNIMISRYMPNMVDLCFFARLVISGGGTIVRESSLLNVPSIEFFPGETAPQEHFLMKNGFPLYHIKDPEQIVKKSKELLLKSLGHNRFTNSFKKKIEEFENPNNLCFNVVEKKLWN